MDEHLLATAIWGDEPEALIVIPFCYSALVTHSNVVDRVNSVTVGQLNQGCGQDNAVQVWFAISMQVPCALPRTVPSQLSFKAGHFDFGRDRSPARFPA